MTTSASIALLSTNSYVPNKVEAELRLNTLSGSDNLLANGGKLVRTIPGQLAKSWTLGNGITTFGTGLGELPVALTSSMAFVIEAPTGKQVLDLGLEILDYTSGWETEQDRVEIRVTSTGVSADIAPSLAIDSKSYSWRLSCKAPMVGSLLKLSFELVQEKVPTDFVDTQAITRLAFTSGNGSTQAAVIRVKRFDETVEPTS